MSSGLLGHGRSGHDVVRYDPEDFAWLAQEMPGATHCRPGGGDGGTWVKLGWAYNQSPADKVTVESPLDEHFPDIVLRGAARLNLALKTYYGQFHEGCITTVVVGIP
jgi:hypothetical protein